MAVLEEEISSPLFVVGFALHMLVTSTHQLIVLILDTDNVFDCSLFTMSDSNYGCWILLDLYKLPCLSNRYTHYRNTREGLDGYECGGSINILVRSKYAVLL